MTIALVTGGAGFIGSHLVEGLIARGHRVRVLDDLSSGKDENLHGVRGRIDFIKGSVTDPELVRGAVAGTEWVFHLAALPSVQRSIEAPLATHEACGTGTLNVLHAAVRAGVRRVVYAASSSAYGGLRGELRTEDDPVHPLSPYAAAKLAGEFYCQAFGASYGLEAVRLRFFNIFGPRQRGDSSYSGVVALFIAALLAGRSPHVYGDGEQSRDFTYVGNAVQALLLAAQTPTAAGNVYNVGCGVSTSVLDLYQRLQRIVGCARPPSYAPARTGDPLRSRADITRARRELGYEPLFSLDEGLQRTVASLRVAA
jgi:UDP-glucose 4-epimerase